jgi:hypothetical protein
MTIINNNLCKLIIRRTNYIRTSPATSPNGLSLHCSRDLEAALIFLKKILSYYFFLVFTTNLI